MGRPNTALVISEAEKKDLTAIIRSRSMPPEVVTHWTVRSAAAKTGISKSTVGRYFARFGVQPHRARSFKLSTDPLFVEKVRDIVGLYLNPPDKALVLCVVRRARFRRWSAPNHYCRWAWAMPKA